MPTIFTHALVGYVATKTCFRKPREPDLWALAAFSSLLPDMDSIGMGLGIDYADFWGHRGFMHSILFAFIWGMAATTFVFRGKEFNTRGWWAMAVFLSLITASHGLLDALTDGGLGIAFFSPFDTERYFLPWQVIRVSQMGYGFFSESGLVTMQSELMWIWLPTLSFYATLLISRDLRRRVRVRRDEQRD